MSPPLTETRRFPPVPAGLPFMLAVVDLIFDPHDVNMALRKADLRLMYRAAPLRDPSKVRRVNEDTTWVLLDELRPPGPDPRSVSW